MSQEEKTYKRLYRNSTDRVIAGVCGGVGEYLNFDPVVVRIIWLASILIGGTGFLAYLIAWVLIPEAPVKYDFESNKKHWEEMDKRRMEGSKVIGIVLVAIALLILARQFHFFYFFNWDWFWPVALIVFGAVLILKPQILTSRTKKKPDYEEEQARSVKKEDTLSSTEKTVNTGNEVVVTTNDTSDIPTDNNSQAEDQPDSSSTEEEKEGTDKPGNPKVTPSSESEEGEHQNNNCYGFSEIRRTRNQRVFFGVCSGIARHYNLDPVLVRLIWTLLTIFGMGIMLLIYILLIIVIPEEEVYVR